MSERVNLGDVVVHHGVPPNDNPHHEGLSGEERFAALRAARLDFGTISTRRLSARWTFWHVPYGGPYRMLSEPCTEIDWSTMRVDQAYPYCSDGSLRGNADDI